MTSCANTVSGRKGSPRASAELRARFEALEGRAAGIAALETRTAQAQTAYREAALVLHGRRVTRRRPSGAPP